MEVWAEPQHQAAVMEGLLEGLQQTPAFEHSPWSPASFVLVSRAHLRGRELSFPPPQWLSRKCVPHVHKPQPAPRAGRFHTLWGGCLTVCTLQS